VSIGLASRQMSMSGIAPIGLLAALFTVNPCGAAGRAEPLQRRGAVGRRLSTDRFPDALRDLPLSKRPERTILAAETAGSGECRLRAFLASD
jgi:hypothetical protein